MSESHLVIQRDMSMVVTPGRNREAVAAVARSCCELRKVVAGSYLYRLSPIAIWGSVARGIGAAEILRRLERFASSAIPASFAARVSEISGRYGAITLSAVEGGYRLASRDPMLLPSLNLGVDLQAGDGFLAPHQVGRVKLVAARAGWPVVDAVAVPAGNLSMQLREEVRLRPYQADAVEALRRAGSGVVLLPCGAGKTIVGVAAMSQSSAPTLVLGPSRSVAEQWRETILEATTLQPEQVSIAGAAAVLAPVTIATYHAATLGQVAGKLLDYPWGTVIYDEVQSLPADVFRLSAALAAPRKIGLSATLVREDGRQGEVFALIGPPVYDVPWTELEEQGWIAPARCTEVRIPFHADADQRERYKQAVVERLLARHEAQPVLIVGSRLATLEATCRRFGVPALTGASSRAQRSALLEEFRSGERIRLGLSRIGSVGIDLPGAEVLIQISGTFGSRQEEAQRLGRLLRPAPGKVASFYSLVAEGTAETRYAEKRQRFLVEQGYGYEVMNAADLPRPR